MSESGLCRAASSCWEPGPGLDNSYTHSGPGLTLTVCNISSTVNLCVDNVDMFSTLHTKYREPITHLSVPLIPHIMVTGRSGRGFESHLKLSFASLATLHRSPPSTAAGGGYPSPVKNRAANEPSAKAY